MISLILSWFSFIIFISSFLELTQLQYFLYGCSMFWFIYLYNCIFCVKISPYFVFVSSAVPSILFWYVAFVYNDFLSLTPMKYEVLVSLLFFYLYILIYIIYKTVRDSHIPGRKTKFK
jgi:hypothetical protein